MFKMAQDFEAGRQSTNSVLGFLLELVQLTRNLVKAHAFLIALDRFALLELFL